MTIKTRKLIGISTFLFLFACSEESLTGDNAGTEEDMDEGLESDSPSDIDDETETDTAPPQGDGCEAQGAWWVWDLSMMPPSDREIEATVRGYGEHVCVVVADDVWQHSVTQEMIDGIIEAWDHSTPADGEKGIFEIVTDLFGDPPDEFDGEPRIYLLLYEMEGFGSSGFDAYFRRDDQFDAPTSNRHETLHINTLMKRPDSDFMLSVQAHELQHLIHWQHDPHEISGWFNEAMSEVAMVASGFGADTYWLRSWLKNPTAPLFLEEKNIDYGIVMLFGIYLWERFGDDFLRRIVTDERDGLDSIEALLAEVDPGLNMQKLLADLSLAIAVNDTGFEQGIFGFEKIDLPEVDASRLRDLVLPGKGSFAFLYSEKNIDGAVLRVETDVYDELELRVAVVDGAGPTRIDSTLTGPVTELELGSWPEGETTLWVTSANASSEIYEVKLSLVSPVD